MGIIAIAFLIIVAFMSSQDRKRKEAEVHNLDLALKLLQYQRELAAANSEAERKLVLDRSEEEVKRVLASQLFKTSRKVSSYN